MSGVRKKITNFAAMILCAAVCGCGTAPSTEEKASGSVSEIFSDSVSDNTPNTVSHSDESSAKTSEISEATTEDISTVADSEASDDTAPPSVGFPRTDGSTSATPLDTGLHAAKLGISYSEAAESVRHTTTHNSFERLLSREVDLIFSVPISDEQRAAADNAGLTLTMTPVAKEGFVFIVNVNNPVDSLTSEQIRKIYSGEIKNWKEVGGVDAPIRAYQRNNDSGSQNYMTEFMGDVPLEAAETEYVRTSMGFLVDAVSAYDNSEYAIGYSVYSYAAQMYESTEKVKFIAVDGVKPTKVTIADGSYPLSSCTYMIYTDKSPDSAKKFAEWAVSDEGQRAVLYSGYLPVNGMEIPENMLPYEAFGTGTRLPDGQKPDVKYTELCNLYNIYIPSIVTENGYYRLKLLKDKEFEEQINSDIKAATDELRARGKKPKDAELSLDYISKNSVLSLIIGYRSFEYCYAVGSESLALYYDAVTLNYDLFEKKKLERFSDLFYEGSNFVPTVNSSAADYVETVYLTHSRDVQKADFAGFLGEPRLFTIESVGLEAENLYFQGAPFLRFNADEFIITNKYRDLGEVVDERYNDKVRSGRNSEWKINYRDEDGMLVPFVESSLYHTEAEIKEHNKILETVSADARSFIETEFGYFDDMIVFYETATYISFEHTVEFISAFYDKETAKRLSVADFFGDGWTKYFQQDADPDDYLLINFFDSYNENGEDVYTVWVQKRSDHKNEKFYVPLDCLNERYFPEVRGKGDIG